MPQAKKSTSTRRRPAGSSTRSPTASVSSRARGAFKEPAALKRLNKALDEAQKALAELGAHGGRDVETATRALRKDVRGFLTSARRNSGKLGTALKRDFEQAQKQLTKATKSARGSTARRSRTAGESTAARGGASRTTAGRRTSKRS
jgi:hypothetical protein